jgi:hypothetical protein
MESFKSRVQNTQRLQREIEKGKKIERVRHQTSIIYGVAKTLKQEVRGVGGKKLR